MSLKFHFLIQKHLHLIIQVFTIITQYTPSRVNLFLSKIQDSKKQLQKQLFSTRQQRRKSRQVETGLWRRRHDTLVL